MSVHTPEQLFDAMRAALETGDASAFASHYEMDVVLFQDGTKKHGRDIVRETFAEFAETHPKFELIWHKIATNDDVALIQAHWRVIKDDGSSFEVRPAAVARRQPNGIWQVAIDMPGEQSRL
jgi:uncharacterized protein (TIGR02246 family)